MGMSTAPMENRSIADVKADVDSKSLVRSTTGHFIDEAEYRAGQIDEVLC